MIINIYGLTSGIEILHVQVGLRYCVDKSKDVKDQTFSILVLLATYIQLN